MRTDSLIKNKPFSYFKNWLTAVLFGIFKVTTVV